LFLDRGTALPNGKTPDPLASVQVRQALNYAVDRNAITKGILGKYGIPTSEAPTVDGFDPAYQNYYPYNPAKAKALLAVAGYPAGFTINVADQTFFGTLGDPVLEAMAKYLSAVGVRLNITQSSSLDQWLPNFENGTYSATGFTQEPFVPMYQFYHFYLSPGGIANQHGWHDPVLDKLWQQGAAATPKASSAYWQEMSRRVVTQADEVPVFEDNTFWYTAKDIGGVAFSSANSAPLPTEWYIK
jgi:peptide/nickel transport system substrate-binding protein